MKLQFSTLILTVTLMSCTLASSQIQITEIIKTSTIKDFLNENKIEFIKEAFTSNLEVRLYGEKIDSTINTLYKPHYSIDWEKETALPNIFYKETPFKNPILLTDKSGKIKILTAIIGNTEPIEIRQLNVFDNDQVIELKKLLIKEFGNYTYSEEDTYQGNLYYWETNNKTIRLTIENECLCKQATSYRPKNYNEKPQGGRNGLLTIYYDGIKPQFY